MTKNSFQRFFKESTPEAFAVLIEETLEENDNIELKSEWISPSAIAKTVLGLANTNDGAIIIGVQEDNKGKAQPIGISEFVDKAQISKKIRKHLPSVAAFEIRNLIFEEKYFQIIVVNHDLNFIPYVSVIEGPDIAANRIYIRKDTITTDANYIDIQELINRRIESAHSNRRELNLDAHINELKMLFRAMPEFDILLSYENSIGQDHDFATSLEIEGIEFIRELISMKKEVIKQHIMISKEK